MTTNLEKLAQELANLPYSIDIEDDETEEGEHIFFVSHPELPGCVSEGETLEEARKNLLDAAKEYILSLLEDGLPVPRPRRQLTVTSSTVSQGSSVVVTRFSSGEIRTESPQNIEYAVTFSDNE